MNLEQLQQTIHEELAKELLRKLRAGEATAADLSVIRQYLKDNNISGVPAEGSPLKNLVHELPFTTDSVN